MTTTLRQPVLKAMAAFLVLFSTASQAQVIDAPTPLAGTAIGSNSFTANWQPVTGAIDYRLDVSTSPTFDTPTLTSGLMITEYVEGSAGYKAVEIYNGTGAAVNMAGLFLRRQIDGGSTIAVFLSGVMPNNSTRVYAYSPGIAPDLQAVATNATTASALNFDGNDAMQLVGSAGIIDIVGIMDTATFWGADVTLRRKSSVTGPTATYSPGDWDVYPMNDITGLGSHTINPTPSFVPGYEDLTVNGTAQVVSGLAPATNYYYRVRAVDAVSTSLNSTPIINVVTSIDAPVATAATLVGATSFTANWEPVAGATSYALDVSTSPTFGNPILASDLIISEYVEGGPGYKAIEIYNGTGADINLGTGGYRLRKQQDGAPGVFDQMLLTGVVPHGSTHVVTFTGPAAGIAAVADQTNIVVGGAMDFDGNDAVILRKGAVDIDVVGVLDQAAAWGADMTLRRKSSVNSPTATYSINDWDVYPMDDIADIGLHTMTDFAPSFVSGYENLTVNGTSQIVSGLTPQTVYYYRVRAIGPDGTSINSNVIQVTMLAQSTFGSIVQAPGIACQDEAATFNLTGLTPNSTYTISYDIDGGPTQTATGVLVDPTGAATIEVVLGLANDGQTLTVTAVERTDIPSSVEPVTTNNTVVLDVTERTTFYVDADLDGYGDTNSPVQVCEAVLGLVPDNTDCNDGNADVHPGATEIGYNLIDDDCDGSTDEGFPAKNTVIQTAQCDVILDAVDTKLVANLVGGAQGYRWQITTMNGPSAGQVQFLDTPLRTMKLIQLADYAFNTQYKVELAVLYAGFWQPFRASNCTVTTPATTTRLTTCGQTLTAMSDVIYADIVPFTTGYRFRITDPLNGANTQVIDRYIREFRMDLVTNFVVQFGKQYNVEVAIRNTDGSYLPYGGVCAVNTPAFPTVSLQDSQCDDYSVPTANAQIYATLYPGAIAYVFQISGSGLPEPVEVTKTLRTFNLNDFPMLLPGATYNVRVRLVFNDADPAGPYGNICTIVTPGLSRQMAQKFDAVAYPNPFADSFNIDFTTASEKDVTVKVYDMLGRLLESKSVKMGKESSVQAGENYPSGVYNIIITQGEETKTLRVVKR